MKRTLSARLSLLLALVLVVVYSDGNLASAAVSESQGTLASHDDDDKEKDDNDAGDDDSDDDDSDDDDSDDDDSDDDDSDDDDSDDDDSDDDDSDDDDSDDDDSDDDDSDDDDSDDDENLTPEQVLAHKLAKAEAKAAKLRADAEELLAKAEAKAAEETDPEKAAKILAEAQEKAADLLADAEEELAEAPADAMEEAIEKGLLGAGTDPALGQAVHRMYDELAKRYVVAYKAGHGLTIAPEGQTVVTPQAIYDAFGTSLRTNTTTGTVTLMKDGVALVFGPEGVASVDGQPLTPEVLSTLANTSDPALKSFALLLTARAEVDAQGNPVLIIEQ